MSADAADAKPSLRDCKFPSGAAKPRLALLGKASERAPEAAKAARNFDDRR
jgi:hypothetical protein